MTNTINQQNCDIIRMLIVIARNLKPEGALFSEDWDIVKEIEERYNK